MRKVSLVVYDSSGNCITNSNEPDLHGNAIIPNSNGEEMWRLFKGMSEIKNEPRKYDLFKSY